MAEGGIVFPGSSPTVTPASRPTPSTDPSTPATFATALAGEPEAHSAGSQSLLAAPPQPRQRSGSLSRFLSRIRSRRKPSHTGALDQNGSGQRENVPPVPAAPRQSESTASFGGDGSQPSSPQWSMLPRSMPMGLPVEPKQDLGDATMEVSSSPIPAEIESDSAVHATEEPRLDDVVPMVSGNEDPPRDPTPTADADAEDVPLPQSPFVQNQGQDQDQDQSQNKDQGFIVSSVPPSSASFVPDHIPMSDSLTGVTQGDNSTNLPSRRSKLVQPATDGVEHEGDQNEISPQEPRNIVVRRTLILPSDDKHRVCSFPSFRFPGDRDKILTWSFTVAVHHVFEAPVVCERKKAVCGRRVAHIDD